MELQTYVIDGIGITPCEFEIISHLMKGLTQKEVAAALDKKPATIASQLRALYLKTGFHKLSELVVWAAEHGFDSKGNYTPYPPPAPAKSSYPRHDAQRAKIARRKKMRKRHSLPGHQPSSRGGE